MPWLADLIDPPSRPPKSVPRTTPAAQTAQSPQTETAQTAQTSPKSSPSPSMWFLGGSAASLVLGFAPLVISIASIANLYGETLDCRTGGGAGPVCAALNMGGALGLLAIVSVPLGVFAAIVLGVLGIVFARPEVSPTPRATPPSPASPVTQASAVTPASAFTPSPINPSRRPATNPTWQAIAPARRPLLTAVAVAGLVLAVTGVLFPFRSGLEPGFPYPASALALSPPATSTGPTVALVELFKLFGWLISFVGWFVSAAVSLVVGGVMVVLGLVIAWTGAPAAPPDPATGQRTPPGNLLSHALRAVTRLPGEPPRAPLAIAGAIMASTATLILLAARALRGDERLAAFRTSILEAQQAWLWDDVALPLIWAVALVGLLTAALNLPDRLRRPSHTPA